MSGVKNDKFGDEMFSQMYDMHRSASLDEFKKWGVEAIRNHTVSSNLKKDEFIQVIRSCNSKDRLVVKLNSIFMAGLENMKVYKPGVSYR